MSSSFTNRKNVPKIEPKAAPKQKGGGKGKNGKDKAKSKGKPGRK